VLSGGLDAGEVDGSSAFRRAVWTLAETTSWPHVIWRWSISKVALAKYPPDHP
jgi:hypothetical protein